jgi:hypothetical protein
MESLIHFTSATLLCFLFVLHLLSLSLSIGVFICVEVEVISLVCHFDSFLEFAEVFGCVDLCLFSSLGCFQPIHIFFVFPLSFLLGLLYVSACVLVVPEVSRLCSLFRWIHFCSHLDLGLLSCLLSSAHWSFQWVSTLAIVLLSSRIPSCFLWTLPCLC